VDRLRSWSLLVRFGLASALLLVLFGLALAHALGGLIEQRAHRHAEQSAVLSARMTITPLLQEADYAGVVTGRDERLLDRAMLSASRPPYQALRLKIFNSAGLMIYSDAKELVGKSYDSVDLRSALRGAVISKTTQLDEIDERWERPLGKALEVYLPMTDGDGTALGVAELYVPYAPVQEAIDQDTRRLYLMIAVGLATFFLVMYRMVARASRRLQESSEEIAFLAYHDQLTSLPNRAQLLERMEPALKSARSTGGSVGVLLIDLDRFKEINETLGHSTGDELLRHVAQRIRRALRPLDLVARLGGDEFAVLLPDLGSPGEAHDVVSRILERLHQPFSVHGVDLAIEASIGIACSPADGDEAGSLLQHADVAMYAAKHGGAPFAAYDPRADDSSLSRIVLLNELRRALDERQLVLHYQPKTALADGQVRSVEALVRWEHPTRGLVAPDEFITVAEHTGLIGPLTEYVLGEALANVRAWRDRGWELSVAVNLSARSLMDLALPGTVAALLDSTGVEGRHLEVEITETSAMADPIRAGEVLRSLARLGVGSAVDDYGTGYSSLSYLRSLPIGALKIDRSFVSHMLEDEGSHIIVRSTIELAHNLGLTVVAEGVEDAATYSALADMGCDLAQGYHISRPLPAAAVEPFLRRQGLVEQAGR